MISFKNKSYPKVRISSAKHILTKSQTGITILMSDNRLQNNTMEIKKASMYCRREQSIKKSYGGLEHLLYKLGVTSLDSRVWLCAAANPALVRGESGGSWGLASCPVLAGRAVDSTFTEELLSQKNKVENDRAGRTLGAIL